MLLAADTDQAACHVERIPDELLGLVLSFCDIAAIPQWRRVSQRWNRLINDILARRPVLFYGIRTHHTMLGTSGRDLDRQEIHAISTSYVRLYRECCHALLARLKHVGKSKQAALKKKLEGESLRWKEKLALVMKEVKYDMEWESDDWMACEVYVGEGTESVGRDEVFVVMQRTYGKDTYCESWVEVHGIFFSEEAALVCGIGKLRELLLDEDRFEELPEGLDRRNDIEGSLASGIEGLREQFGKLKRAFDDSEVGEEDEDNTGAGGCAFVVHSGLTLYGGGCCRYRNAG